MNESALAQVAALLEHQRFGVLCTSSGGWPYASLVALAASADLRHVVFATPEKTQKTANLQADGRVALLVDDRSNRAEDCQRGTAVTILGRAEISHGDSTAQSRSLYLEKHPDLAAFADAADTTFVCVHVERYRLVEHFQTVTDIAM